ncbi:MAG TPA: hypothetical protein VKW08_06025 [Xanthobacteraceae bacterium]|jgi:hypothetical protein|nr:hypothetical protein [Xanthobacteraceae bacterium]
MRATGTLKLKTSAAAAGDISRALWAGGIMIGVCGLAAVAALFVHASSPPTARSSAATEGDLSTGSMLVVSPSGTRCAQGTIDNSTWQIHNQGWIDCDEAIARAASAGADYRPTGGTRLDIIRDSFRGSTAARNK